MKRWSMAGGLLAAAIAPGCVSYQANITGIIVEPTNPEAKLADLTLVDISGDNLAKRLFLSEKDEVVTNNPMQTVRIEGSWTYREKGGDYKALVGGIGTTPGAVKLDRSDWTDPAPYVEASSGWTLIWGIRPRGRARWVRAIVQSSTEPPPPSTILLHNDPASSKAYVFLIQGEPVELSCKRGPTDAPTTQTLSTTNSYVEVDVDSCGYSPARPMTVADLGFLDPFVQKAKRIAQAAYGTTVWP